jgi:hypothetical protein
VANSISSAVSEGFFTDRPRPLSSGYQAKAYSADIFGRLPARHAEAFHQLVGHLRGQPVAQSRGSINFRVQDPIDFRFRQPLACQEINELSPSEMASGAFDDNDDPCTPGTYFPQIPGPDPAVDATHIEKISAGFRPAPPRTSPAEPA